LCSFPCKRSYPHGGGIFFLTPFTVISSLPGSPYRSLVLGLPWERNGVDTESLSLLEKAIELFRPSGNGERTPVDTGHLEDFALLDVCLVRECMEEHGLLNG